VPVGDPEVTERRGRDHLDVDAGLPRCLDRVADEQTSDVILVAGVGRGQDDDLHKRREKTIGAASASIANAKK
jgi:hypothetical protein